MDEKQLETLRTEKRIFDIIYGTYVVRAYYSFIER